jgi:hypothetical protein
LVSFQALRYYLTRDHTPGWIEDSYDGKLYQEIVEAFLNGSTDPALLEGLTVWRLSNDPAELDENGSSWLPVLLSCLSLPPWLRRQLGAMHLGLLLPDGVTNLQLVLPFFLDHLHGAAGCGSDGPGVLVPATAAFPVPRRVQASILFCSNDTRATPKANCMVQSPALVGASPWAWVDGYTLGNTTACLQVS